MPPPSSSCSTSALFLGLWASLEHPASLTLTNTQILHSREPWQGQLTVSDGHWSHVPQVIAVLSETHSDLLLGGSLDLWPQRRDFSSWCI